MYNSINEQQCVYVLIMVTLPQVVTSLKFPCYISDLLSCSCTYLLLSTVINMHLFVFFLSNGMMSWLKLLRPMQKNVYMLIIRTGLHNSNLLSYTRMLERILQQKPDQPITSNLFSCGMTNLWTTIIPQWAVLLVNIKNVVTTPRYDGYKMKHF